MFLEGCVTVLINYVFRLKVIWRRATKGQLKGNEESKESHWWCKSTKRISGKNIEILRDVLILFIWLAFCRFMCVSFWLHMCLCLYVYMYVCMYVCMYLFICLYVCLSSYMRERKAKTHSDKENLVNHLYYRKKNT